MSISNNDAAVAVNNGRITADEAFSRLSNVDTSADEKAVLEMLEAVTAELSSLFRDPTFAPRLAHAGVTVVIEVVDTPGPAALSLLLDREPLEARVGQVADPDVVLLVPAAELEALCSGQAHLPTLITAGKVGYEGPVRRVLRVLPILRRAIPAVRDSLVRDDETMEDRT